MPSTSVSSQTKRARRSFWTLVFVSILAAGSLSAALSAPPGSATGLRLMGSGLVLIATVALAARVHAALVIADRRATGLNPSATTGANLNKQERQGS